MADQYRPPGMNRYDNRYPPPPGTNGRNFQFQANMSHPPPPPHKSDSYRGGDPSRQYYREPSRPQQELDSYRPPQGDFTFRQDAPGSIIENSRDVENRRPQPARSQNHASDRRGGYNQRGGRQGAPRGRGNFRGRGGISYKASDRPFLKTNRDATPELMEGMDNDDNGVVRFRPVNLSDSDEAEMDLSEDEKPTPANDEESEQPPKKQARTLSAKATDGDSVPRWSNPDPYTALPPPDESQRKKTDIVKLIRKSKVVPTADGAPKVDTPADDFISFDFGDESDKDGSSGSQQSTESHAANYHGNGMPGAPTGPRDPTSGQRNASNSFSHRDSHQQRMAVEAGSSSAPNDQKAGKMRFELDKSSDPALGSRKRNADDEIKYDRSREGEASNPQRQSRQVRNGKKNLMRPVVGEVTSKWLFRDNTAQLTSSPWCDVDHSRTPNMGFWLHKEIMDFYEYVKPRPFEDQIRTRLVTRLQRAVKSRWLSAADIRPFGSFPSGLYLPTADMDLVLLSKDFLQGGRGMFAGKNFLFQFRTFLVKNHFAESDSIELIMGAKVPLVKYIDRETKLRVDVSFENMTGVIAIDTFLAWKEQYPAMPIIVTLVKQFLAMRGLNEPVNGGIGGFTVTCLVTSLLQNLPSVQSGNMVPEHHLNEILMEFFNLYGNEFDTSSTAIQLNPPGYVSKAQSNYIYRQSSMDRLSVIDPNNSNNDIAGGSSNTPAILDSFSKAYGDLVRRMGDLNYSGLEERKNQSILSVIVGGDYSSFKEQREHLAYLHEQLARSGP